jgi:hypothetical protein
MKIIFLILICSLKVYGAFEIFSQDPFTGSLSNSVVASDKHFSAFLLNPAVTASLKEMNIGLIYFKPYTIGELNAASITSNFKIKNSGAGLSISSFGNSLYQESQLTLNLSQAFFEQRFCLGLNINLYNIKVQDYPNLNTYGIDLGILYIANESFRSGFSIENINQPSIKTHTEELPLIARWGIGLRLDEKIQTYVAVEKDSWFAPNLSFGMDYQAGSFLSIQTGYKTYPSVPSIGFILKKNWIYIQYGFQYHFELGGTHLWGITFSRNSL